MRLGLLGEAAWADEVGWDANEGSREGAEFGCRGRQDIFDSHVDALRVCSEACS